MFGRKKKFPKLQLRPHNEEELMCNGIGFSVFVHDLPATRNLDEVLDVVRKTTNVGEFTQNQLKDGQTYWVAGVRLYIRAVTESEVLQMKTEWVKSDVKAFIRSRL